MLQQQECKAYEHIVRPNMKDIIIGIDAGTSVIKSVAFTLSGKQVSECAIANEYYSVADGGVEQCMDTTWQNTLSTLIGLSKKVDDLTDRVAAIAVTGQGDGTWLIDKTGKPACPAWLWLDARAGSLVEEYSKRDENTLRYQITGTGISACQQSAQLLWMHKHAKEIITNSATAFHCKDWLYYNLTGERVTDPSEGCFTFGNYKNLQYSDDVLELLGLEKLKYLLPPILDGKSENLPLSAEAASITGLLQGTPVILGYIDIACTVLGAGVYDPNKVAGCTVVGSTGIHSKLARSAREVTLNSESTGYTIALPIDGAYAQIQSNMSSTLNIDWLLDTAVELMDQLGAVTSRTQLLTMLDEWIDCAKPGSILYQPYISDVGERGPFIDNNALAGFIGLSTKHRFPDLVRAVVEGLAFASRDCYEAMGSIPKEIRLTGGAARSKPLRDIFGNVLGTSIRTSSREEAGAAGAAMMAAVNIGHYRSMDDCVSDWVTPFLGDIEDFDDSEHRHYTELFGCYQQARKNIQPIWKKLGSIESPE